MDKPEFYNKLILNHYKNMSIKYGSSQNYSMQDKVIRKNEFNVIYQFIRKVDDKKKDIRVLEVGCGNGYYLDKLSTLFPNIYFEGIDFCPEAIDIANKKKRKNNAFKLSDVCNMSYENNYFDIVISVRCLINILDVTNQKKAIDEIGRILSTNGYLLLIECFKDGHVNYNKLRRKFGLPSIKEAYHNLYLNTSIFNKVKTKFSIEKGTKANGFGVKRNFLSTHYLFSRVFFCLFVKNPYKIRNSIPIRIVSLFPNIGNYSPLQSFVLKNLKKD